MSSSDTDLEAEIYQLAPMRKEILELKRQRVELDKRVDRLARDVFHDGPGAVRRIDRMLGKKDAQVVCDALDNKGLLNDRHRFGVPKVSWFDPGSKARVDRHVDQLKTAIRTRAGIDNALKDKIEAYEVLARTEGSPSSPDDIIPSSTHPYGGPFDAGDSAMNPILEDRPDDEQRRPWFRRKPNPDDDSGASDGHEREAPGQRER